MTFISSLFKALFRAIQIVIAKLLEFLNKIIFGITNLFITMRSIVYQIIGVMAVQINIFEEFFFIAAAWMLNVVTFTSITTLVPLGFTLLGELACIIVFIIISEFCFGCMMWAAALCALAFCVTLVVFIIASIVCILMFQIQDGVHEKIEARQKVKAQLNTATNLSKTKL